MTDYLPLSEAQILEKQYVEKYKNDKWFLLNKTKTGGTGGNELMWNKEKCIKVALNYKYRDDFRKEVSGAYSAARNNNGWTKFVRI